jgi:hypothetical protein
MVATKVMENDDWFKTQQFELMVLPNTKAPWKKKPPRKIVESLHLDTIATSYNNTHFPHITQVVK